MRVLHRPPSSPASRALRLALAEKGLEFALAAEPVWERRPEFLARNPAGDAPMLAAGGPGTFAAPGPSSNISRRRIPTRRRGRAGRGRGRSAAASPGGFAVEFEVGAPVNMLGGFAAWREKGGPVG